MTLRTKIYMTHSLTRIASLLLAFGLFFSISCSNLDQSRQSSEETNPPGSLRAQIEQINQQVSENPENTALQAQKADLLYQYAQTFSDPADRKPIYKNLRDVANGISFQTESNNEEVEDLLVKAWSTEQREGVELLHKRQSGQSDIQYPRIIAHFDNAKTLMPDSLATYNVLATTYYQQGNINQAIQTLVEAEQGIDGSNPQIKEKLAYLYLESGNLEEATQRYQALAASHPNNLHFKHGLVNALILNENHVEAIELLEELSDGYPTRYNYKESLATELYYLFKARTDQYLQDISEGDLSENSEEELTDLLTSIHTIFESIQENLPSNEENLYRIAAFYKKASDRLENISEELPADNPQKEAFEDLNEEYLEYALPLWERLAEINPDNMEYLQNLYQVYLGLGMQENAQSIERSYNF